MQALIAIVAALVVTAYSIRGTDSFSLIAIACGAWALASIFIGAVFHFRPASISSNRAWGAIGLAFLFSASVVLTRWPLRLGPVVYRSQFQALADSVAAGHTFNTPRRIGPFMFQRGQVERGYVCLWTDLDPAGRAGYVRGSAEGGIPFNIWSVISTGPGWHFLVED